ncbi:MAG: FkbM family methyltransferase [Salinivirgaceae bacterium]|jgi:FkbM family methyltransferase|nr:FkbM family methyltransferase [Salinivirgaceae bacterium]
MWFIKRILFKIVGIRCYLKLVRSTFLLAYKSGMLRNKNEYYCHYKVPQFINKGDTIIDIGANLGYYSWIFARATGKTGVVYAVEPVQLFRDILQNTIKKHPQVKVLPYALGDENGKETVMGLPATNKYLSHGRTKIIDSKPDDTYAYEFTTEMRTPDNLFGDLKKLDYIKCDIEGFEIVVIPQFKSIIEKHKPTIQIETDGENRNVILQLLLSMDYKAFYIHKNELVPYDQENPPAFSGDLIFRHSVGK